mmetsp:Transcript_42013/g.135079  ORF Transcript_42013/g.135079 Transcript_42013/m.135079 type:complete len:441 (-) Transcript_42013:1390-2712(-)
MMGPRWAACASNFLRAFSLPPTIRFEGQLIAPGVFAGTSTWSRLAASNARRSCRSWKEPSQKWPSSHVGRSSVTRTCMRCTSAASRSPASPVSRASSSSDSASAPCASVSSLAHCCRSRESASCARPAAQSISAHWTVARVESWRRACASALPADSVLPAARADFASRSQQPPSLRWSSPRSLPAAAAWLGGASPKPSSRARSSWPRQTRSAITGSRAWIELDIEAARASHWPSVSSSAASAAASMRSGLPSGGSSRLSSGTAACSSCSTCSLTRKEYVCAYDSIDAAASSGTRAARAESQCGATAAVSPLRRASRARASSNSYSASAQPVDCQPSRETYRASAERRETSPHSRSRHAAPSAHAPSLSRSASRPHRLSAPSAQSFICDDRPSSRRQRQSPSCASSREVAGVEAAGAAPGTPRAPSAAAGCCSAPGCSMIW